MVTVIIPTNRFHCIENVFKQCINNYNGNLFRFEIHDSSIDNDIENLYKKYKKKIYIIINIIGIFLLMKKLLQQLIE